MGVPLLFTEEFEVVIMIEVVIEEMHGSDRDFRPENGLRASLWLEKQNLQLERNGALL